MVSLKLAMGVKLYIYCGDREIEFQYFIVGRDDNPFLHEKIENEKNKDRKGQYYAVFVFCFYNAFVHSSRVINKCTFWYYWDGCVIWCLACSE